MSWKKVLAMSLTVVLLMTVGCENDSTTTEPQASQAPSLPPPSSMHLNLGFFQQAEGVHADAQGEEALTRFNWAMAVITAIWINVHVEAILIPPFLAFQAAIHTIPSAQPDGWYLWIYTWVDPKDGNEVQIRLRGRDEGDHVRWELRITNAQAVPPLDQTLWFYGESSLENDSGFWVFNDLDDPDFPEVARLDWNHAADDDRELSIEVTGKGHEDEGDKLTYRLDGREASMILEDVSESEAVEIIWNTARGTGSYLAPDYNEGERACWDENQEDVDCATPAS